MSIAVESIEPISEELVRWDNEYLYEIVNGQRVEKPRMGAEADPAPARRIPDATR